MVKLIYKIYLQRKKFLRGSWWTCILDSIIFNHLWGKKHGKLLWKKSTADSKQPDIESRQITIIFLFIFPKPLFVFLNLYYHHGFWANTENKSALLFPPQGLIYLVVNRDNLAVKNVLNSKNKCGTLENEQYRNSCLCLVKSYLM